MCGQNRGLGDAGALGEGGTLISVESAPDTPGFAGGEGIGEALLPHGAPGAHGPASLDLVRFGVDEVEIGMFPASRVRVPCGHCPLDNRV